MMSALLSVTVRRLRNERGEINIVAFAISLPVLVLVGTAAMDIVRYPITKQQIGSAAESGIDYLILEEGDNATEVDAAAGKDWCAILSDNHPRRSCPACDRGAGATDCTGALDSAGAHAVKMAVNRAYTELTKSGMGVMTHAGSDVTVVGGIFNLVASADSSKEALIIGVETVSELSATEWGGSLGYPFNLSETLKEKFVTPGNIRVGHFLTYMPEDKLDTTDAPVAVFGIAVRIHNVFKLPSDMQFGVPLEALADPGKETLIVSTIIRPLPRGIRLSGELLAIPD